MTKSNGCIDLYLTSNYRTSSSSPRVITIITDVLGNLLIIDPLHLRSVKVMLMGFADRMAIFCSLCMHFPRFGLAMKMILPELYHGGGNSTSPKL